jgi:hypothetical protein
MMAERNFTGMRIQLKGLKKYSQNNQNIMPWQMQLWSYPELMKKWMILKRQKTN